MLQRLAVLIAVCALLLPTLNQPAQPASAAGERTDELIIARKQDINAMDPGMLTENAQVVDNIFDTLLRRDANMQLQPWLATEYTALNDTTWQFKLRQGVKFHNGEPFNAEAVKFSIERVLDPEKKAPTISYIRTVDHVEVVDEYTVNIVTKAPDPLLPTRMSRYPTEIVPPNYVNEKGDSYFASHPVGTGAYRFVEWVKDERLVLEANPDWWHGPVPIKRVVWRPIPEDATRMAALYTGEVDIAFDVPLQEVATLEQSATARLERVKHGGLIIYIGLKSDEPGPLADKRVRQALNYAVDVDSIVTNILGGLVTRTTSLIGPADFGYYADVPHYPYDPEKAKALLAEAGYPAGFEVDFDTAPRYMKSVDVAQAIAEQLARVGVRARVRVNEWGVYTKLLPQHKQAPLYILGWGSTNTLDADAALYAILHSGEPYSTYSDPTMDKLLEKARFSMNPEERQELYKQISLLVREEAPRIFLYQEDVLYGVARDVNFQGRIDASVPVYDISLNR